MNNAIVLLGAGASFDCDSAGASCKGAWRPPLTKQLFNLAENQNFEDHAKYFSGVMTLAPSLAEEAKADTFSLEEEMRRLAGHSDPRLRRHFQDIPRYLASLFLSISQNFTVAPGGYSRLIIELLAERPHRVVFVSLNYDTLLEMALSLFSSEFKFQKIYDYCQPRRQAIVVKPHGSADWSLECRQVMKATVFGEIPALSLSSDLNSIQVGRGIQHGPEFNIYPALTAPVASKELEDFRCPSSHIEELRKRCGEARKILMIGTSCLDDDVLALVAAECPSPELMHIVIKGGPEAENAIVTNIKKHWPGIKYPYLEVFRGGFKDYLGGERLQLFCRHEPSPIPA